MVSFEAVDIENVFAYKNNKSVAQTLEHRRYVHLRSSIYLRYSNSLEEPLGSFVYRLKQTGDLFYTKFLNRYGDSLYCSFSITDQLSSKGLYAYVVAGDVKYIGRCRDSYDKRINQNYGHISPKNCYLDGQSTNCRLNALINQVHSSVELYVCPFINPTLITEQEILVIQKFKPTWNIRLS